MARSNSGAERRDATAASASVPLLLGGVALAIAEIGRRLYRNNHIFCPSAEPVRTWRPVDYGIPDGATEELWIETENGQRLHAWYCRSASPVASGVFCHGNTGNLTISADIIPHLLRAGLNILFFDYRGFGRSSGRPSVRGVIADAVAAARRHDQLRPRDLPSVVYGFSLGGAVAAQLTRHHSFDALILQSTFTSLAHLTRALYPRLPLHLLAGKLFDTLAIIRTLQIPLLVLHGTDDEVIPCTMAHEIFGACAADKRIHCVEGGLHKDLYERDPDALVRALADFLANVRRVGVRC